MPGNGDSANIVRRLVLGVIFLWPGIPDEWRLDVIIIDALERVAITLHLENIPMWYLLQS